jgi:hypothetical protein
LSTATPSSVVTSCDIACAAELESVPTSSARIGTFVNTDNGFNVIGDVFRYVFFVVGFRQIKSPGASTYKPPPEFVRVTTPLANVAGR